MTIPDADHYELLELPRDASHEDVERAYRMARATWGEDALAAYSVASEAELGALRERVEQAYRVLSDADARGAYDAATAPDAKKVPFGPFSIRNGTSTARS